MTRTRTIALGVALICALTLGACGSPPPASSSSGWQDEMLASINGQRAAAGLAPLSMCGRLVVAAQAHSQDQAGHATMTHTGSDGSSLATRVNRVGYLGWSALGENVAAGQPDVGAVMGAWMNSPGHRANILGGYTSVGVGQARAANGTLYWTQDFGARGSC